MQKSEIQQYILLEKTQGITMNNEWNRREDASERKKNETNHIQILIILSLAPETWQIRYSTFLSHSVFPTYLDTVESASCGYAQM